MTSTQWVLCLNTKILETRLSDDGIIVVPPGVVSLAELVPVPEGVPVVTEVP